MRRIIAFTLTGFLFLTGCSGHSAYQRVFKQPEPYNFRTYPVSMKTCWLAVNRAVLGLNFGIDKAEKEEGLLEASKHFQEGKKTTTIVLKASLETAGSGATTVYVNVLETRERVFARSHTRFFLWIIPLPGGGGTVASRVTEGARTVTDVKFYGALFEAVGRELDGLEGKSERF